MELPRQSEQTVFGNTPQEYRSEAVNPAAFGSTVGPAVEKAGDTLSQIAIRRQDIYNENITNQAVSSLMNNAGEKLRIYRTLQGQDAVNALDSTTKDLNEMFTSERAKLNPAAQRQFDFVGQRILRGNIEGVNSHWDQQFKKSTVDSAQAVIEGAAKQGSLFYSDSPSVSAYHGLIGLQVDNLGKKMGWTPEELSAQHDKASSAYFHGVMQSALADKDYGSAQHILDTYKDDINPLVRDQMRKEIKSEQSAAFTDEQQAHTRLAHVREETDRKIYDSSLKQIDAGTLTAHDVLQTAASPALKENLIRLITAKDNQEAKPVKTNPTVFRDLFQQIHSDGADRMADERPINDAFVAGNINYADLQKLHGEFTQGRTEDGSTLGQLRKNFNASYSKTLEANPVEGPQQWFLFNNYIDQKVTEYRKDGKNPIDLFNPASKDFVGNAMPMFQKAPAQIMQDEIARKNAGNKTAAEAYLAAHPETKAQFKKTFGYLPGEK